VSRSKTTEGVIKHELWKQGVARKTEDHPTGQNVKDIPLKRGGAYTWRRKWELGNRRKGRTETDGDGKGPGNLDLLDSKKIECRKKGGAGK